MAAANFGRKILCANKKSKSLGSALTAATEQSEAQNTTIQKGRDAISPSQFPLSGCLPPGKCKLTFPCNVGRILGPTQAGHNFPMREPENMSLNFRLQITHTDIACMDCLDGRSREGSSNRQQVAVRALVLAMVAQNTGNAQISSF